MPAQSAIVGVEPFMLTLIQRNLVLISSFVSVLLSLYILAISSAGRLRNDPLTAILFQAMRPFQIGAQASVVSLRKVGQKYSRLLSLLSENEKLERRLFELEEERHRLLEAEAANRRLQELLELKSQLPAASKAATVIASTASSWFQSITIDKGNKSGIQSGMAVISRAGVLGHVVAVGPNSSKVLLVTDPHSAVDVVVQRSRARGIVAGSLNNGPVMKYVRRSEDVQVGDRLVTSGLDGIYPKGLLVGTVQRLQKGGYGLFQHVEVSLAVDPLQVEEVLVVSSEAKLSSQ
jgi:rod shape-determining protein MreC